MTPIENILSRLEKVKQRQPGQWSACCPAHSDKGPSLSVRETPDGAVLLYCFAGCEVGAVVAAMGLELHELFPPRDVPPGAPKRTARLLTAGQALELLANEAALVFTSAATLLNGRPLSETDKNRLLESVSRINLLRNESIGGRHA